MFVQTFESGNYEHANNMLMDGDIFKLQLCGLWGSLTNPSTSINMRSTLHLKQPIEN